MKQTTWGYLLMAGSMLMSCQALEDKKPENLIPTDQMASILAEVHMAEARVSRLGLGSLDSSNVAYKHMEKQVFKKFQVDTAAYTRSFVFYSSHPRQMEAIYKQVVEKLTEKAKTQTPPHS